MGEGDAALQWVSWLVQLENHIKEEKRSEGRFNIVGDGLFDSGCDKVRQFSVPGTSWPGPLALLSMPFISSKAAVTVAMASPLSFSM